MAKRNPAAESAAFGAASGTSAPAEREPVVINGTAHHPETLTALPGDRSAAEWQGVKGYVPLTKEQSKKREATTARIAETIKEAAYSNPNESTARDVRKPRQRTSVPTNRSTGVDVKPAMGIKEYGSNIDTAHSILQAHINTIGSFKMRPEAAAAVDNAKNALGDAKFHIDEAAKARRGVVIGNKRFSGDAEAARHYNTAVGHLRKAHDFLSSDHVSQVAQLNKASVELPTAHIEALEGAAKTSNVVKPGKSFQQIPFGGTTINPKNIDVKQAEGELGKAAPAVQKLKAAQKGTKRQDKFRVLTGQEEKSLGGLPGPEVRTVGRNGIVGTPINPKRKASSQTRITGRLSNANMSAYQTPKFGEPGRSGKVGPRSDKPLDTSRNKDRNNRGGKGGAV